MFKKVILLLALLASFSSHAIDSTPETIRKIRTTDWAVVVSLSSAKNGCGGTEVKLSTSLPHIQNILSVALAAQMAKKQVLFRYVTCSNLFWPNTAEMKDLIIYFN
jgi:hypothetical protein